MINNEDAITALAYMAVCSNNCRSCSLKDCCRFSIQGDSQLNDDYCAPDALQVYCTNVLKEHIRSADLKDTNMANGASEISKEAVHKELRDETTSILLHLGVPTSLRGFVMLRDAIMLVVEDPNYMMNVTSGLYNIVGERYNCTGECAERLIRYAIEKGSNRSLPGVLDDIFGNSISSEKGKPTNTEFIAGVADVLRRRN